MKCLDGLMTPPSDGLEKVTTTEVNPPKPPPAPKVAVMINSLGATPLLELHVAAKAAREWLKNRGLNPARVFVGSFMTALNMTGFSVTLCALDQQRLSRLDADVVSAAWPLVARAEAKLAPMPAPKPADKAGGASGGGRRRRVQGEAPRGRHRAPEARDLDGRPGPEVRRARRDRAARRGEGAHRRRHEGWRRRLRHTFARGAAALLEDAPHMPVDSARDVAIAVGLTVRRSMGGTSGALYDIFFAAAGVAMRDRDAGDPETWFAGFEAGVAAARKYGGALPGNRTMLDALVPALEAARAKVTEGRASSGVVRSSSPREPPRKARRRPRPWPPARGGAVTCRSTCCFRWRIRARRRRQRGSGGRGCRAGVLMTVMARGVHVDIIILRSVGNEAIDYYALRNKVRGAPNTSVRAPTSVRANTYLEGNKVIPTCNKRVTPFERPSRHAKPSTAFYLHHPRPPRGILHDPRPFGVEVLLHDGFLNVSAP